MEREGMKRRGRRGGGEMRRGIVIGGMVIGLLMGCNNGIAELEKEKESILSISKLRQGFLDVFSTFGNMVSDALGIDAKTTKKQVGEYVGTVGEAVRAVKGRLEGIKETENYNSIKDKADSIIANAIATLEKIVDGTSTIKKATGSADGKIANAGDTDNAIKANETSVQELIKGISMIYEAAKNAEVASKKGQAIKSNGSNFQEIAKLFNQTANADANALKAANEAVNTVSGADILAAIETVKGESKVAGNIENAKNAYDIAIATPTSHSNITDNVNTNASAIAAGLALRAMAQSGKLATKVSANVLGQSMNAVLIGVVDKTVNEILSIIKRTVDKCLKDVSDCIKEDSGTVVKSK